MYASPNKRARVSGSFSPASPPYHLAKGSATVEQTVTTAQPNTPASPSYMSTLPNANGESPALNNTQRFDASPTSVATMSQFSQAHGSTNTFPTPASSVTGTFPSQIARDGDGDVAMGEEFDVLKSLDQSQVKSDAAHRRSDHDRLGEKVSETAQNAMKSYPFVCEKPFAPSRPWHVSANTLREYGLDALANSVRRTDPVTGAKINKLRKTYKDFLQGLRVPGRSDPVIQRDQFSNMYRMQDDWWQTEEVGDHDLESGFDALLPKLGSALRMDGVKLLPESEKEARRIIGADDAKKKPKVGPETVVRKPGQLLAATSGAINASATAQTSSAQASGAPSPAIRPTRPGTKRRYNDSSFKGYGEGYADDDLADSTAGEDDGRGGMKKKRRKENYPPTGSLLGPPGGYSNVSMVGVRR